MITNINVGVDPSRVVDGKPSFFVNWKEDGKNNYVFSFFRWKVEDYKNELLKKQGGENAQSIHV